MPHSQVQCADIVLASVQNSPAINVRDALSDAEEMLIISPASMEVGTIEVSWDNSTWTTWQILVGVTLTDVAYPAASKAGQFPVPVAPWMRIHVTAGATAATRTMKLFKKFLTS
jgi:hypothetical protein